MTTPDIYTLATPVAVIIAAVVERIASNRTGRKIDKVHELVNSRLTLAINEIAALKAAAAATEKQDLRQMLEHIEQLILNVQVNPKKE